MNRNASLNKEYSEFIEEDKNLGHLEKVEAARVKDIMYFMPHHPVLRPESLTCNSKNGVSLNDVMLIGPTLQPDPFQTMSRLRFYRFDLTDAVRAYQVKVAQMA